MLKFMFSGRQKPENFKNSENSDFMKILDAMKRIDNKTDDCSGGKNYEAFRQTDDFPFNSSMFYLLLLEIVKTIPILVEDEVKKAMKKAEDGSAGANAGAKKQAVTDNKKPAPSKKAAWRKRKEAKKAQNTNAPAPGKKAPEPKGQGNRQANATSNKKDGFHAAPTTVEESKEAQAGDINGASTHHTSSKTADNNAGYTPVVSSKAARRRQKVANRDPITSNIDSNKWKAAGNAHTKAATISQGQTKRFLDKTKAIIINPVYKKTSDSVRNIFEIFSGAPVHVQKGCIKQFIKIVGENPSCPGLQRMVFLIKLKRDAINNKMSFTYPSQEELEFHNDDIMLDFLNNIDKYYEIMMEAFYTSIHHDSLKFEISKFKREFKKLPNFAVNQNAQQHLTAFSNSLSSIRNGNCHSEQAKQLCYIEMIKLVEYCANNAKQRFVKFGDIVGPIIPSIESPVHDVAADILTRVNSLMAYNGDAAKKFQIEFLNKAKATVDEGVATTDSLVVAPVVPAIPAADYTRNCPPDVITIVDDDLMTTDEVTNIGVNQRNKRVPSFSSDEGGEFVRPYIKRRPLADEKSLEKLVLKIRRKRASSVSK